MAGEALITVTGRAPYLMHNNTLVDPLHEQTKALKKNTSKPSRSRIDEDEIAKYRIQFEAGLYWDPEAGPYIPGVNVADCLWDAAKTIRGGPKIKRGLIFVSPINRLQYDGPRDVSGLWNDLRFRFTVPVNGNPSTGGAAGVMACRPIFREWSFTASMLFNPAVLSVEDLAGFAQTAGQMIGLGDWRPWHGRFEATVKAA